MQPSPPVSPPPSPASPDPRRRRRVAIAVALIVVPFVLAPVFLVAGLFGPLVWVYLSIAVSLLWLPCLAVGIVLLVRR